MAETHRRTAFTAALLLDRRQAPSSSAAAITGVAVDQASQRLFLGLEDGVLEEHAILTGPQGARASLAARKHAAKKAIVGIHHLAAPASGGSRGSLLVLLTEDGVVHLLDGDSLEGAPMPLRHVLATCIATPPGRLPLLAAAMKPGKRSLRFLVYELQPSRALGSAAPAPLPQAQLLAQVEVPDGATAVHGMGWVGAQLAVCAGMRYLLVSPFRPSAGVGGSSSGGGAQWRELFSVPEELAYSPAMLAAIPDLARALMVVGPAGIVVDAAGNPVGSALPLESLGATPRALAAAGPFLLVVSEAGIHVFDRDSGSEVQRLGFAPGLHPLPGQPLYAAAAASGAAGCVAVAGRRIVWLCQPVPAADQAWELLGQHEYEAALELVEGGLQRGEAWAQVAAAQAALLLLHECRFEEAVRCLEQCGPDAFQPAQLFPLFPTYTAPWAQQAPSHKPYWALHAPLHSLETLISRKLGGGAGSRHRHQQQQHGDAASASRQHSPSPEAPGSTASSSLFGLESGSAGAASPSAAASPTALAGEQHGDAAAADDGRGPQNGSLQHSAAGEAWAQQQQQQRGSKLPSTEWQQLQRRAWEALAQYLFRVRMLEGVTCLPGVDTLLLLLLADLGDARQVAAFAAVPNEVDLGAVEARLQAEHWHHALATLHAARGGADAALHIWRQVADGQLAAPADPEVQAAERREALESAAALLRDPRACPDATLVGYVPWLLGASQPAALGVLTARSLTPAAVLPLLPEESDVRWQYLAHLVEGSRDGAAAAGPAADPELHTQLATQLASAILRAEPGLRSPEPPAGPSPLRLAASRRASAAGSSDGGGGRGVARTSSSGSAGAGRPRRLSRTSTAALVSGGSLEPWPGAGPVDSMRLRLRRHLEQSSLYDAGTVLRQLAGTGLHQELVVLHSKVGDHMAALRLLALTLRNVAAAEAYACAHLAPPDYRALLHLVLEPGPGLEPRWEDACYLIAALGDHLDPQEVLTALPPSMPLATAAGVLAPMLCDRLHRRRQGCVAKNLQRARLAAASAALSDAQSQQVAVDEERACPHCHLRLGGKVFVVLQPGMLPTQGAAGGGGAAAAGGGGGGEAAAAAADAPAAFPQQQWQQQRRQGDGEPEGLRPPGEDSLAAAARRLQQQVAAGQAPHVLCYACYRRLAAHSGAALPDAGVPAAPVAAL